MDGREKGVQRLREIIEREPAAAVILEADARYLYCRFVGRFGEHQETFLLIVPNEGGAIEILVDRMVKFPALSEKQFMRKSLPGEKSRVFKRMMEQQVSDQKNQW